MKQKNIKSKRKLSKRCGDEMALKRTGKLCLFLFFAFFGAAFWQISHTAAVTPDATLTWSPPSGWQTYAKRIITASESAASASLLTITLQNDTDYIIEAPYTIQRAVRIRGGRNVVWIGGHIQINDKGLVNHAQRKGIFVQDNFTGWTDTDSSISPEGRIVHLEGILIDGDDVAEGITTHAPSAVIQLQNIHLPRVYLRGADDRDGTGAYAGTAGKSHPDIIQTYGSQKELRIDRFDASSNYQGFFFKEEAGQAGDLRYGPIRLRRITLENVELPGEDGHSYAATRMYYWYRDTVGQQFIDNGTVWIKNHRMDGKVASTPNPRASSGSWWHTAYRSGELLITEPPPGTAVFSDAFEMNGSAATTSSKQPQIGYDSTGEYATWPSEVTVHDDKPGFRNWTDTEAGRIYSGRPAVNNYLSGNPGLAYVSPGYESDKIQVVGDVNGDRLVNTVDLAILLSNYGQPDVRTHEQGDLSGDGMVNIFDISIILTHWSIEEAV